LATEEKEDGKREVFVHAEKESVSVSGQAEGGLDSPGTPGRGFVGGKRGRTTVIKVERKRDFWGALVRRICERKRDSGGRGKGKGGRKIPRRGDVKAKKRKIGSHVLPRLEERRGGENFS